MPVEMVLSCDYVGTRTSRSATYKPRHDVMSLREHEGFVAAHSARTRTEINLTSSIPWMPYPFSL